MCDETFGTELFALASNICALAVTDNTLRCQTSRSELRGSV